MTATPRHLPLHVGLVAAAALTLAACSGMADDAPRDADPQAFCDTFYDRERSAQDVAAALVETGTPDDVSDDERTGFELWVEGLDDEGDTPNVEIDRVEVPEGEREAAEAFSDYVVATCLDGAVTPSAAPSEPAS